MKFILEGDIGSDKNYSKLNSSEDYNHKVMNSVDKVSSMPIFKLLQGFKLQQYAKALFELGYGYEIYKFTFLSENAKANLINKLNLMPGHRARFLNFFEF